MPPEAAVCFDCAGDALVGILHRAAPAAERGIVIVVGGGPQYRAGGHRQLTLWSRRLCAEGWPVLRFDYRGMGDAHGEFTGFTSVDDDIRAAIDHLVVECPSLREIVLWGECDAASAILYYAHRDPRVIGAVLLNPWVRTDAGAAQVMLRHYYLQRLLQPSFWRKLLSGHFKPAASLGSAVSLVKQVRQHRGGTVAPVSTAGDSEAIARELPLTEGLLRGLQRFGGQLLLVLSGRDLIAREFDTMTAASPAWQSALSACNTQRHDMPLSDHTFSSATQRRAVVDLAIAWLAKLAPR